MYGMLGKNSSFRSSQFLSFIAHKMASRVPIQPKPSGAYSTCHIFRFVHRKTSAISRSRFNRERGSLFALLFLRSRMLPFLPRHLWYSSFFPSLSFTLLLVFHLSLDTLHVAGVEEIHARKCILEHSFSRTSLPFLLPLEGLRRGTRVGNLRATDFGPRLPLGPTEVEDRSSVWCESWYLD